MHDSEFEKQVQQKMQELRFAPGADVWTKVQADIREKRRRRPVMLWVLLAGLLIGSSWFLYTGILSKKETAQVDPAGAAKSGNVKKETSETDKAARGNTTDANNTDKTNNTGTTDNTNNTGTRDDVDGTNKGGDTGKMRDTDNTDKTSNTDKTDDTDDANHSNKANKADKTNNPDKMDKTNETDNTNNANKKNERYNVNKSAKSAKTNNEKNKPDNTAKPDYATRGNNKSKDQPLISKPVQSDIVSKQTDDLAKKDPALKNPASKNPASNLAVKDAVKDAKDVTKNATDAKDVTNDGAKEVTQDASKDVKDATKETKDITKDASKDAKEAAKDVKDVKETRDVTKDVAKETKDITKDATKDATKNTTIDSLSFIETEKPSAQSQPLAITKANDTAIAMKNTAVKKSSGKNTGWEWGLSAGVGISDLGNQIFKTTSVADFAYGGASPSPNTPTTIRRPPVVEAGAAFQAGGYVSKNIGKKLKLKLGLNYEYFSNSIRTGSHVESTRVINQGTSLNVVQDYYNPGNTNKFTNRYHFLSLPISLQWKLNNHKKWGLIWENGVSPARLLSTEALHYDGISGAYYKDNKVFKKTQWMVSSSLLFNIKTKNNLQLYAGPQVQYGLSNLVSVESQNKHLRYAGLKLMVGFNKK